MTQELAFRCILIGQAGDAGLAVVLIVAIAFVCGILPVVLNGTLHGVVLGSLYSLSRSLLVPAVYYGAATAGIRAFDLGSEGAIPSGTPIFASMVATGVVAAILAYQVQQKSGFMGLLTRQQVLDAPSD